MLVCCRRAMKYEVYWWWMEWGIDRDTTGFTTGTTNYVIPASHNQFCQEPLPYITTATALLTTAATTFYLLLP